MLIFADVASVCSHQPTTCISIAVVHAATPFTFPIIMPTPNTSTTRAHSRHHSPHIHRSAAHAISAFQLCHTHACSLPCSESHSCTLPPNHQALTCTGCNTTASHLAASDLAKNLWPSFLRPDPHC